MLWRCCTPVAQATFAGCRNAMCKLRNQGSEPRSLDPTQDPTPRFGVLSGKSSDKDRPDKLLNDIREASFPAMLLEVKASCSRILERGARAHGRSVAGASGTASSHTASNCSSMSKFLCLRRLCPAELRRTCAQDSFQSASSKTTPRSVSVGSSPGPKRPVRSDPPAGATERCCKPGFTLHSSEDLKSKLQFSAMMVDGAGCFRGQGLSQL